MLSQINYFRQAVVATVWYCERLDGRAAASPLRSTSYIRQSDSGGNMPGPCDKVRFWMTHVLVRVHLVTDKSRQPCSTRTTESTLCNNITRLAQFYKFTFYRNYAHWNQHPVPVSLYGNPVFHAFTSSRWYDQYFLHHHSLQTNHTQTLMILKDASVQNIFSSAQLHIGVYTD